MASFAGVPATTAQGELQGLEGAPVDIHEGNCDDFITEPAYDGGVVELQSLSDLRENDDNFNLGITEDGETLGVDVNGDGALDDTEIVGGVNDDVQVGVATTDIGEDVDEDMPWVSVLHAGPDTYETTLACGSITEGREVDGNRVAYLAPLEDSGYFGYSVLQGDGTEITTYIFQPGQATAGTPEAAEGYPIDIHEGTCADWTFEPAYDGGVMQVTNVGAEDEQDVGDTEAELPEAANALGDVYHVDNEADFTANELREEEAQHVVAVHQSEDDYATLVACGPVLDIPEDDNTIVPLMPVGDSNQTGVAIIPNEGDGEITAFLWQCEPLEQKEFPTPTPTPEPTPTPTPEPSPTPEPTVVVEETEVITETEVVEVTEVITETEIVEETEVITETREVLAPTATALAQEQGGQQPEQTRVTLGEESPEPVTVSAGSSFIVENTSENDRTFIIEDLGIDEEIPAGEELEVQIPQEVEAGTYPFQVQEGGEDVFDGELTVE